MTNDLNNPYRLMAQIDIIGIGLDGAIGVTDKVKKLVENATLLVGSARHLSYFPGHPTVRLVLSDLNQSIEELCQLKDTDERIVVLVSGDPLFFGLGRLLLEKLPPQNLHFHPHVTSVQLAFSQIKVPWQDARIVSSHGRSLDELTKSLQQGIEKIAVLTDGTNNPSAIARLYLSLDLPASYEFWICENLGDEREKITHFLPDKIAKLAFLAPDTFSSLNVVILLRENYNAIEILNTEKLPILGLSDRSFVSFDDRPGLMTKREIRLIVLGELALQPEQTVWDIGAGTGSVSLEIARLCPTSRVYAIEKSAMGKALIEQNSQRLQVDNIKAVYGSAPNSLNNLPQPNRIFIGGSGGNLLEILDVCEQKLLSNGTIVLALATLEHLNISLEWFNKHSWNYRLLQVQISRSVSVGDLMRFSPLNPVTIVTATNRDRGSLEIAIDD
jgi:precorrin-6B C5,15-methyltransferase / cobalt-precorrin-6B C5,C15-methyltransferase